ncbi:uncharacterized protein PSFLO_07665 [Pseudozyma flocculosa]|uniref:RRM domain-containing protein n=1 Tax=Pseudozyma flocculosa TaxID=84751 RepID=A0A5C3FCP7_9BASI|nr:uncharacterized protein PSFLO_07665 [Pseudozyma flocculosa]
MDVEMRDAPRRSSRRGAGAKAAQNAPRRSDPYARDAKQRPAARARYDQELLDPQEPAQYATTGMSYPPPQLNIKGSSGPTWVVVSNLAIGTSAEDIELTFGSFGRVTDVKTRNPPGANHPSVSYEVAFEHRHEADLAVEKFHGALADGRVLSVSIKKPDPPRDPYSQFSRAAAQAIAQRPRERAPNMIPVPQPAPAPIPAAVPTGPAAMRSKGTAKVADLLDPRAKKPAAAGAGGSAKAAHKAAQAKAAAPVKSLKDRIPEPLVNRLLTPAQAQKLRAAEARQKAKAEAQAKALALAGGKKAKAGGKAATPGGAANLQSRISVPLAQRLAKQAGTPKSDLAAQREADKKKKKRAVAKAKKKSAAGGAASAGMEIDA